MSTTEPRVNTNRWMSEIHLATSLSDHGRCAPYIQKFYKHFTDRNSKWNQLKFAINRCVLMEGTHMTLETQAIINGQMDYNDIIKNHCHYLKKPFTKH